MAKGFFVVVVGGRAPEVYPTRFGADLSSEPQLEDMRGSSEAFKRAELVLFFQDNGDRWIMKDRFSSTIKSFPFRTLMAPASRTRTDSAPG